MKILLIIDKILIKKYTSYLEEKQLSVKTINRKLVSLNQFIEFLNFSMDKRYIFLLEFYLYYQ